MSSDDITTIDPAPGDAASGGWTWLDTAGLAAGIIVILIAIDVFTHGRLISGRIAGNRPSEPAPESVPGDVPAE